MSGRPIIFPACARSRESEAGIRALEAVRREPCKGSRKPCAGSRLRQAGSRAPEIVHRTPCNGGKPYAGSRAREAVRRNPGAKSRAPKRAPEAGRRKPGAGSRAPEAGRWKPGAGSRASAAGRRKPEAGSRAPEAARRAPGAGRRTPDAACVECRLGPSALLCQSTHPRPPHPHEHQSLSTTGPGCVVVGGGPAPAAATPVASGARLRPVPGCAAAADGARLCRRRCPLPTTPTSARRGHIGPTPHTNKNLYVSRRVRGHESLGANERAGLGPGDQARKRADGSGAQSLGGVMVSARAVPRPGDRARKASGRF